MSSRRSFLNSALGGCAALALAAQGMWPATAQQGQAGAQPARRRIIVDSQVHMWLPQAPDRPWPADGPGLGHGARDPRSPQLGVSVLPHDSRLM
jgi:hypothetical protein